MADSREGASIAERSSNIKRSLLNVFEKSRTTESPVEMQQVEDVLDRFKLWTGNLGALHPAHKRMSLESRLADSPEVKEQVCEQLDDMQEAIQDLLALFSESRLKLEINEEDAQDSKNTDVPIREHFRDTEDTSREREAESILCMVSECLRALFRIGILVRKATPRDRFERALQQSEYAFAAQFDINYVEERYPKLVSNDSSWLASRLGTANSKRRQFINYVRDHRAKLEVEDSNTVMDAPTLRQSSKATTFVVPGNLSTSEFLQSSLDDDDDSVSLVSASTAFDDDTSLRLPRLADLSPDGEHFECPICFTLQSFHKEKAWKLHAYRDLKAYVCTSAGQECENKMFSDRDSWFDHELKHHHSLYLCKLCRCQYSTTKLLEQHVIDEHGTYTNEGIKSIIEHDKLVPSQLKAQDCPFCDKWASILSQRRYQTLDRASSSSRQADILVSLTHFKRHVATHQEQLAIFAMPRTVDDDGGRSEGASDSNSEALSSKEGNSQAPHSEDIYSGGAIHAEFRILVTTMCEKLLANPPSDPQEWGDQYGEIVAMVTREVERKRHARNVSRGLETAQGGSKIDEVVNTFLMDCPPFAALKKKHDELQAIDDYQEGIPHLPSDIQRVKVYKLVNNDWEDQGTGICIAVTSAKTGPTEARIIVDSETEPGQSITEETVDRRNGFQKQQDTLILWTNHQTNIDMALSFEYPDGRRAMWEFIQEELRLAASQSDVLLYEGTGNIDVRDTSGKLGSGSHDATMSGPEQRTDAEQSESAELLHSTNMMIRAEQEGQPAAPQAADNSHIIKPALSENLTPARDASISDEVDVLRNTMASSRSHRSSKGKARSSDADYEQSFASLSLTDYYDPSYTSTYSSSYEPTYSGSNENYVLPAQLQEQSAQAAQSMDAWRAARAVMALRFSDLAEGDTILPPCDRCRRLRMQCIKKFRHCQGCTEMDSECRWKTVSDDELSQVITERAIVGSKTRSSE